MTPNNVPGMEEQATNVPFGKVVKHPIEYDDTGATADVELRFSIALPQTQALGGNSQVGKHYKANTGISFVRVCREIDFGCFGYFNEQEERQRWWGCEIRFDPRLDELFGVTNNKQNVRGMHYLNVDEFKAEHPDDADDILNTNRKMKLRYDLSRIVGRNLSEMMKTIKSRGVGKRGGSPKERAAPDKSTRVVNEALRGAKTPTKSAEQGAQKSLEQKKEEWTQELLNSDETLKLEEAAEVANVKIELLMEKEFGSWPGSQFFTVETVGGTCVVRINKQHPFFVDVYEPLMQSGDDRHVQAVDLTLMSFARTEDELYARMDDLDEIRDIWGRHLKKFLLGLNQHA